MRPRRRQSEGPSSHDRWLVSYSDFMTLLFALFVVLFASSYRDSREIPTISRAIHAGFQEMGAFSAESRKSGAVPQALTSEVRSHDLQQQNTLQNASASIAQVERLQRELQAAMGSELRDHEVVMRVTPEGFVISLNELGFFDSGKATLLPGAPDKIQRIAKILARNGMNLRIEGHSDNQPIYNGQFRSNWELSTARAMTVLLLLVNNSHFDPGRISVAGYGEYRPVASNATAEGRRMNRRVDLVVLATAQHM